MELELDFSDTPMISKSEVRKALDAKRAKVEAELRQEYRQQGLEYKANSAVIGDGEAKDPMLYNIRKYVLIHIIENPHLAKHGAFKRVWDELYSDTYPYNYNMTNTDIRRDHRLEIISLLKDKGMFKRGSYKRTGQIIDLVQEYYENQQLREENARLRKMLTMYLQGDNIVINGVMYRGDKNYYYLPNKVRKGTFDNAIKLAESNGLIDSTGLSALIPFAE